eukprot:3864037-Amphidinium_carterae.1
MKQTDFCTTLDASRWSLKTSADKLPQGLSKKGQHYVLRHTKDAPELLCRRKFPTNCIPQQSRFFVIYRHLQNNNHL